MNKIMGIQIYKEMTNVLFFLNENVLHRYGHAKCPSVFVTFCFLAFPLHAYVVFAIFVTANRVMRLIPSQHIENTESYSTQPKCFFAVFSSLFHLRAHCSNIMDTDSFENTILLPTSFLAPLVPKCLPSWFCQRITTFRIIDSLNFYCASVKK